MCDHTFHCESSSQYCTSRHLSENPAQAICRREIRCFAVDRQQPLSLHIKQKDTRCNVTQYVTILSPTRSINTRHNPKNATTYLKGANPPNGVWLDYPNFITRLKETCRREATLIHCRPALTITGDFTRAQCSLRGKHQGSSSKSQKCKTVIINYWSE